MGSREQRQGSDVVSGDLEFGPVTLRLSEPARRRNVGSLVTLTGGSNKLTGVQSYNIGCNSTFEGEDIDENHHAGELQGDHGDKNHRVDDEDWNEKSEWIGLEVIELGRKGRVTGRLDPSLVGQRKLTQIQDGTFGQI